MERFAAGVMPLQFGMSIGASDAPLNGFFRGSTRAVNLFVSTVQAFRTVRSIAGAAAESSP